MKPSIIEILIVLASITLLVQMARCETVSVYNYSTGEYEYLEVEPENNSIYNYNTNEFSDAERVDTDKHQGYDYNSGSYKDYTNKGNGEIETYNYSTGEYQMLEVIRE